LNTNENIYDLITEYFAIGDDGINILEEQINSDTQLEYFEFSKTHQNISSAEELFLYKDEIFENNISVEKTKKILVQLAAVDNVEAYRTIEKYLKVPDSRCYEWAYLALQESRMLIESKLLEENKILISTGLGGKGLKLRYFIVFFTANGTLITDLQKKIIENELQYGLKRKGGEVENLIFNHNVACLLTIVPMQVPLKKLFNKIIKECNQFGDFLFNDYIITNMKVLSNDEINQLLEFNNLI
jgi:hypothetical protein